MIFWTPNLDYVLLGSIFETLLKKLSSEIILFYFFQRQFLHLHFKYASELILVKIWCLKYQKLFKTLIRSRFQGMYWRAHKTANLTSIQHTVPPLPLLRIWHSLWKAPNQTFVRFSTSLQWFLMKSFFNGYLTSKGI